MRGSLRSQARRWLLMPLDQQQARTLAHLLALIRDDWNEAGIFAALGKCKNERAVNVALAALRAADDPQARTPGVIPTPGPHWNERKADPAPPRNPIHVRQPKPEAPMASHYAAAARAAFDRNRAELCSHGVKRTACADHRETETEESA
jgi:hypothetical protein